MTENTEVISDKNNSEAKANSSMPLNGERAGVLGIKAGMTQIFNQDGEMIPVTVIDFQNNVVTQVKSKTTDGYNAVQIGMGPKKNQRCSKADIGHFKKSGAPGFYHVQEFRVDSVEGFSEGVLLNTDFITEGALVDVTGVSKGKGFQGGMKRYNMAGGFKTHGNSVSHRSLGSIGNRADPAKCFKNKKMPGHMGDRQVTVQNLRVVKIDKENKLILIRGSIPGSANELVVVRKAIKNN